MSNPLPFLWQMRLQIPPAKQQYYNLDGVTFQNGILANVFTDDEYEDYLFSHWNDDLRIMRTSSSLTIGIN